MADDNRQRTTRRTVLGAAGTATVVGLAGCVSEDSDNGNDDSNGGTSSGNDDSNGDESNSGTSGDAATVTLLAEQTSAHEDGLPDEDIGHACEHFEFGDSEALSGAESADGAPEISATHQLFDIDVESSGYVVFHGGEDGHDHSGEEGDHGGSEDGHDHDGEEGEHEEGEGGHDGENGHDHGDEEGGHDGENGHDHGGEEGGHDGEEGGHDGENGHDHDGEEGDHSGGEGGHDESDNGHDHGGEAYAFFADGGSVSVVEGTAVHEENGDVPACGPADMYVLAEPDENEVVLEITA